MADQEGQTTTDVDFAQEMEALLAQHDYELPRVGDIRKAIIVSISSQGIIVDLGLKRDGIIQPSDLDKLDPEERDGLQVDDEIPVYITSTDEQDSLDVSLHMARLNEDWIQAQEKMDEGEIFEVTITGHNRGGALAPFGRLRGFIPASHLTFLNPGMSNEERQERMGQAHGKKVPVKVIEVDRRRRRLVLSHREAERVWQAERRRELLEQLDEGDVVTGQVTGWRDFGAFVDLGGADGLVHISELAWHRVDHPRDVVSMGEELDVYILKVDRKRERISLSRKRLLPNPWTLVDDKYHVGQLVEGKIIRIVDYGAFVEVEPGVEGLLHTSQIAAANVNNPREVLKEGEVHLLRVISIEADRQRMGLSLKAVTPTEQIEWMTQQEEETSAGETHDAEHGAEPQAEEVEGEPEDGQEEAPEEVVEETLEEEAVSTEPQPATATKEGAVMDAANEIESPAEEAGGETEVAVKE